jgi:ketosteroid isomerase-like protein
MKPIALLGILTVLGFQPNLALADAANQQKADRDAIFNNAKTFVDAFERGDAKAVAGLWADDGDYVDLVGRQLQGRAAIENEFQDFF